MQSLGEKHRVVWTGQFDKALVDKLWTDKRFQGRALVDYAPYLLEDLRIDEQQLLLIPESDLEEVDRADAPAARLEVGCHQPVGSGLPAVSLFGGEHRDDLGVLLLEEAGEQLPESFEDRGAPDDRPCREERQSRRD